MLYRLVLVDDEDWILSGMQNAIDWESIGFQIVGAYSNGREAKEAILKNPPDAILTDIKMPIMDGISMVRELREAGLGNIEVAFLSGYDDFKLARASIRLGAVDYVLKPSAPEQIVEIFEKIKVRLDERKKREDEKRAAAELVQTGINVFKNAVFNSITDGNKMLYHRMMLLYSELVESERGKRFEVISIALEGTVEQLQPNIEDVRALQYLKETAMKIREKNQEEICLIRSHFSYSFVFTEYGEEKMEYLLEQWTKNVKKDTGRQLCLGRSEIYQDFSKIWDAYQESLESLFHLEMPFEVQKLYLTIGNDTALKAAIEDKDSQIILWSLKNLMLRIDREEEQYRRRLIERLIYGLSIFILQNGMPQQLVKALYEVLEDYGYEPVNERILTFVKAELLTDKEGKSKNVHLCQEVAKYISKNYANDITLNELAEKFYISPNYLGTLFKKNIGVGIKEYQTTIRLEQADALIAGGKFKLYQVAEMVGYPNYEYFRKIYCKYRGKNPSA